ncbi:acetyl/propionyl/methylcrotonyl-CoA carboxylase subunit alpha [Geodermatophilus sp. SYSU D00684]
MSSSVFDTVLVANRGEIAVRVVRTLRRLGIRSVAVYSDADAGAPHVRAADVAYRLGPAPAAESYLSVERVVEACLATGAQAVHPGYGFLSENPALAAALAEAGVVFVGPPAEAIRVMGDKITAKKTVVASGVPVVPGIAEPGLTDDDLVAAAPGIGFPVLVKPSAGGGGKGMRVVEDAAGLPAALASARREARAAFGDDTLFLERFVQRPRHVEVQVLADAHGAVVHLGERECSLQRRHQKVVEEAPSPLLDTATRERIGAAACATARSVGYTGAGTVEFIVSADRPDEFFFMEMNTRLQVEHPVTELVTGLDLVEQQLRVAAGEPLSFAQDDVALTGWAVEARVYAEDPARGFLPTGGRVLALAEPEGARVDSGIAAGTLVGSDYDPMLAKVVAAGPDRATALAALDRALAETAVLGVTTNVGFVRSLLAEPAVRAGDLDTALLDRFAAAWEPPAVPDDAVLAAAAHVWLTAWAAADPADPWSAPTGFRAGAPSAPFVVRLETGGRQRTVTLTGTPAAARAGLDGADAGPLSCAPEDGGLALVRDGVRSHCRVAEDGDALFVHAGGADWALRRARRLVLRPDAAAHAPELTSPMPGTVIATPASHGQEVGAGDPVVVVEAMKMEHTLRAPADGVVDLLVAPGDRVALDQVLARLTPA